MTTAQARAAARQQPAAGWVSGRRVDLQGMRALAVLLVALNHARVPFLPGGYIGVDVFFVLSGYFITGLLLRDGSAVASVRGAGRALARFYGRRARRILPAACLVLVVTSVAVYVTYDQLHANYLGTKPTLLDAMAATFFYANIHFAAESTNYFAQSANSFPSPFQHFWSLSVEEQFYVVWPTVLFLAFFIARRARADRARAWAARLLSGSSERVAVTRVLGAILLLLCAVSLYLSESLTRSNALAAYFSTLARAWEFGVGALLALVLPQLGEIGARRRALLGWIGLVMVLVAAVTFTSSTPFPGVAALLPVLGTAAVIVAGVKPVAATRLLSVRPMAFIGDRSYSFYLWHFPALIIVWQVVGHATSVWVNLLLLVGALALASLTYTYYENPVRFSQWLRGWRTAVMAPVSMALTFAVVLIPVLSVESALTAQATASTGLRVPPMQAARGHADPVSLWRPIPVPAVRAAADAALHNAKLPQFTPSISQLADNYHEALYSMPNSCLPQFGPGRTTHICHLGDLHSHRVVVVFGDSHAQMWTSALVAAAKRLKIQVVPIVKPGCFIYLIHRDKPGWPCKQWYQWAFRQDQRLHPLATVTSFFMGTETPPHLNVQTREIAGVLARVHNGVLLADPPNHGTVVPGDCLSAAGATMGSCSTKEPRWYPTMLRELATMAGRGGYPTLPTLQWFCARGVCPMVINHTVTTHDPGHLTPAYSRALGPLLARELGPVLRRLEARQRAHQAG